MNNYNDENLLEMIEAYAIEMGFISSEDDLSEQFDEYINELADTMTGRAYADMIEDEPMINEMFCNWSDSLCKDGVIHPAQYHEYCYTGEFS